MNKKFQLLGTVMFVLVGISIFGSDVPLVFDSDVLGPLFEGTPRLGLQMRCSTQDGLILLSQACKKNKNDIIDKLLLAGVSLEVYDRDGCTGLHYAAASGNRSVVAQLLSKGAVINSKNNSGEVPLFFAIREKNSEAFMVLVEKGADVKARNNKQETAIHYAARSGFGEIFTVLDFDLTSLNQKNSDGKTAFDLANEHNQRDWINQFLAQHLFLLLDQPGRDEASLDTECREKGWLTFSTCCIPDVVNGMTLSREEDSFLTYAVITNRPHWTIKKMVAAGAAIDYAAYEVINSKTKELVELAQNEEIDEPSGSIVHTATRAVVPTKVAVRATALRKAINRQSQSLTELLIHEGADLEKIAPEEPVVTLTPQQKLFVQTARKKNWVAICRAINMLYPDRKFRFIKAEKCPINHETRGARGDEWYHEQIKSACEEGCFECLESYLGSCSHIDQHKIEAWENKIKEWVDTKGYSFIHYAVKADSPYCIDNLVSFGVPPTLCDRGAPDALRYALQCHSQRAADRLVQKGLFENTGYRRYYRNIRGSDSEDFIKYVLAHAYYLRNLSSENRKNNEEKIVRFLWVLKKLSVQSSGTLTTSLKMKLLTADPTMQSDVVTYFLQLLALKKAKPSLKIPPLFTLGGSIKDLAVSSCVQEMFPYLRSRLDQPAVTKMIADGFNEILVQGT